MSEVKTVLIVDDDPDFLTTNKIVVVSRQRGEKGGNIKLEREEREELSPQESP